MSNSQFVCGCRNECILGITTMLKFKHTQKVLPHSSWVVHQNLYFQINLIIGAQFPLKLLLKDICKITLSIFDILEHGQIKIILAS
jgi:hypothetical protein